MFSRVNLGLPLFTCADLCLAMCLPIFTRVFLFLPIFNGVHLCLPLFIRAFFTNV